MLCRGVGRSTRLGGATDRPGSAAATNIWRWVLIYTFMGVQGAKPPEAINWLKPCYFGTILQNQCQILGGGQNHIPAPLSKYWVGGAPPPRFLRPCFVSISSCVAIYVHCTRKSSSNSKSYKVSTITFKTLFYLQNQISLWHNFGITGINHLMTPMNEGLCRIFKLHVWIANFLENYGEVIITDITMSTCTGTHVHYYTREQGD